VQRTGGPHGKTACFPVSSPQWLIVPRAGVAFREQRTDDQSAGLALSSAQTRLAPPDSSGLGDNIAGMIGTPKIPGTLAVLDGNSVERHMAEPERRPDRELPIRFHDGDREAFTALYRAHFPAVFRFAFYMTGDRILAGEIAQDVFVWLVHHPGAFDAERGELPAFLGGVARKLLHRRHQNADEHGYEIPLLGFPARFFLYCQRCQVRSDCGAFPGISEGLYFWVAHLHGKPKKQNPGP